MDNDVTVLVEDPEQLYATERRALHSDAMLYGRPQKSGQKHSALMLYAASQSRFQWEAHDPQFAAALPVLEVYSQKGVAASGQPLWALTVPPTQAQVARSLNEVDPEESTHRLDHGNYFHFIVSLTGSTTVAGFELEIPDLCDDPWNEWVHPPRDHANTLQPFRQYFQKALPYQWSQLNYRAPNWRIEAEEDTVQSRRDFSRDMAPFRASQQIYPQGPYPAVALGLFEIENAIVATGLGSITLLWGASPGAFGYRLYTNGVPASGFMPATQQQLSIAGLPLDTQFTFAIVPVDSNGLDAGPLSNVCVWEHGSDELVSVHALPWEDPGSDI